MIKFDYDKFENELEIRIKFVDWSDISQFIEKNWEEFLMCKVGFRKFLASNLTCNTDYEDPEEPYYIPLYWRGLQLPKPISKFIARTFEYTCDYEISER